MKIKKLLLPSTLKFFSEGRKTANYSFIDWLHGYVYGRWPYLYIGIGTSEHPLSKKLAPLWGWLGKLFINLTAEKNESDAADNNAAINFANGYHGKVVPLNAARQLVSVNEEVHLTNLEKIIPYTKARDIILKNPDHIVVLECPCRSSRENPCLPLDVCMVIGEPFASFVSEHHPSRSRWVTRKEAVDLLEAEHERGHVQHAFFKDAMLGRFYAICNCCACCCGAMQAHQRGTPMLASSGFICQVDEQLCVSCGICATMCQFLALSMGEMSIVVDKEQCMGCGVCVSLCDEGALELVRAPEKGEPLEIFALIEDLQPIN